MRVLGVDPASRACGLAMVQDGELMSKATWKRDDKQTLRDALTDFYHFIDRFCSKKPDVVTVEKVSVSWNLNTIRLIAYFESVAMLWGGRHMADVVQMNPSTARKRVLSKGNATKEQAQAMLTAAFPKHVWATLDEVDATVLALAGGGWKVA